MDVLTADRGTSAPAGAMLRRTERIGIMGTDRTGWYFPGEHVFFAGRDSALLPRTVRLLSDADRTIAQERDVPMADA
jgi:hypothetical protein